MPAVEHPRRAQDNRDASPRRARVVRAGAGAIVADVRHARDGRRGRADSVGRRHAGWRGALHSSRPGRRSAAHGRSGCTAAPARDSERTGTDELGCRPSALPGASPEDTRAAHGIKTQTLDVTVRRCNTDAAPASAWCRARRGSPCQALPPPCPPLWGHCARFYRAACAACLSQPTQNADASRARARPRLHGRLQAAMQPTPALRYQLLNDTCCETTAPCAKTAASSSDKRGS